MTVESDVAALPSYAVVSPVRDEADHIARTAKSLVSQTHRPTEWVIADDGSTDGTLEIAQKLATEHDWIRVVRLPARAERARGGAVVRAFSAGRAELRSATDIIVKLDGDLFLPPHYFEWVAAAVAGDPRAGVVGGVVYVNDGQRWVFDKVGPDTVHGAIKAYRVEALDDIGGLHESMGWDGIDEFALKARGWRVTVLSELQVLHYKHRGSKQGALRARWEEGRGAHFMGYLPWFVVLRAGYRGLVEPPAILGGFVLGASYVWHLTTRSPRVPDHEAIAELRRDQRRRMRKLVRRERQSTATNILGPAYTRTSLATDCDDVSPMRTQA